jgi:hypothetical protein
MLLRKRIKSSQTVNMVLIANFYASPFFRNLAKQTEEHYGQIKNSHLLGGDSQQVLSKVQVDRVTAALACLFR